MSSDLQTLIRPATPEDAQTIYQLIYDLAVYERLEHLVEATPEKIRAELFRSSPVARAVIAEVKKDSGDGFEAVGFALFFNNFSTFLSQPGLYLEDLYVKPEWRGKGVGKALLKHLAGIAVETGCGRFEWSVLDWNQPAIDVYKACGAVILEDWRICRVAGDALQTLAKKSA
ncbi:MAG: GNAT family N-acetyltransferase [Saezia sp.]